MRLNRPRYESYYRPSFGGFSFFPPVIKWLLIANIGIWLFLGFFLAPFTISDYSLAAVIDHFFALQPLGGDFLVWQLFSYMFMHAGFSHLFFNMFALWMFGMELENTWGSKKFLLYYLTCGFGAGVANLLIAPLFTVTGPTVGASGAIYGVLLAFGMLFPDRLIFLWFLVPIKAKYFVGFYMILEFVTVGLGGNDGVAHFAHLGGAFVGFVLLMLDGSRYAFFRSRSPSRTIFDQWTSSSTPRPEYGDVTDAKVFDIREKQKEDESARAQKQVDEILDKISRGGYQSLTDEEKKVLFEASKRMN